MKRILAVLCSILLLISCEEERILNNDTYSFIPTATNYLIKINSLQEFISQTDTIAFFKSNQILGDNSIKNQLKALSLKLNTGEIIISLSKEADVTTYFLSTKSDLLKAKDSMTESNPDKKFVLASEGYYWTEQDGIFLATNSLELLKRSIENSGVFLEENPNFEIVRAAAGSKKPVIFVNTSEEKLFNSIFSGFSSAPTMIADWLLLELDFENNNVIYHGIAASGNQDNSIINFFKNAGTQKNRAAHITPASAKGFYSFTYSNFKELQKNLKLSQKDSLNFAEDHYLNFTEEAGTITLNSGKIHFLRINDPDLTAETFKYPLEVAREFRETLIYENKGQAEVLQKFTPLLTFQDIQYFAFVEDFLIFSESSESIENIISAYYNKATLENTSAYQNAVLNLAEASSLLIVTNKSEKSSGSTPADPEVFDIGDYNFSAIQFVKEDNFAHLHGILYDSEGEMSNGIKQVTSLNLISGLGIPPYLISNLNSPTPNIAVQDNNNMLYQYSGKGDLISKTQLESRILGEIKQVDIYGNENLQIAFVTQNALHIIDRNGNNVAPFPIMLKETITQPLSIFDYDNNNEYRFVVTQGNNLLMYDSKGKIVKGFDFDKTDSNITTSPVHIRTQNKDYILVQEENKLNILSRQGKSRISVEDPVDVSGNTWFLNKGEFTSINENGEIVKINEQGKVKKQKLSNEGQPKINANEGVLVTINENILTINSKEIVLDFGLYTVPKIYEANNNSYVAVTDLQAKRVLIFDREGILLKGLPVYGNSAADLLFMDNELFFAVQGEENSVILYKIPQ